MCNKDISHEPRVHHEVFEKDIATDRERIENLRYTIEIQKEYIGKLECRCMNLEHELQAVGKERGEVCHVLQ